MIRMHVLTTNNVLTYCLEKMFLWYTLVKFGYNMLYQTCDFAIIDDEKTKRHINHLAALNSVGPLECNILNLLISASAIRDFS